MMTGCSIPSIVHFPDAPPILFKVSSNWMPIGDLPWITTKKFMLAPSVDGRVEAAIVNRLGRAPFNSSVIGVLPRVSNVQRHRIDSVPTGSRGLGFSGFRAGVFNNVKVSVRHA